MKTPNRLLLLVFAVMLAISCQDNSDFTDSSSFRTNAGDLFSDLQYESNGYIAIAKSTRWTDQLTRDIEAIGGKCVADMSQIGMMKIEALDPSFVTKARHISGLLHLVPDVMLENVVPVTGEKMPTQTANPPNSGQDDFFYDFQWGHAAIDVACAWDRGLRGKGVKVAILDSGMDGDNLDLDDNINRALSTSFVPGEGWDVRPGGYFNHGTHVGGIVAAEDNGIGTIGVAPEAELIAVKVLSEFTGSGAFSWIINGMIYATDAGADVINMSLGGIIFEPPKTGRLQVYDFYRAAIEGMQRAADYAYNKGALVVVSAGNNFLNMDKIGRFRVLPSMLRNVCTIAATAPEFWIFNPNPEYKIPASYTNYGLRYTEFAAPGGDFDVDLFDAVLSNGSGDSYWFAAGTSMAAPHVAGVAALIIGKHYGGLHAKYVKKYLKQSCDPLPYSDPRFRHRYGLYGHVNACNATSY